MPVMSSLYHLLIGQRDEFVVPAEESVGWRPGLESPYRVRDTRLTAPDLG
jgi:hypothetical protein